MFVKKFTWKCRRPGIVSAYVKKKNWHISTTTCKTSSKALLTKIAWHRYVARLPGQWNRTESRKRPTYTQSPDLRQRGNCSALGKGLPFQSVVFSLLDNYLEGKVSGPLPHSYIKMDCRFKWERKNKFRGVKKTKFNWVNFKGLIAFIERLMNQAAFSVADRKEAVRNEGLL